MDETYAVNEIKEATCFVSDDFRRDLERTWRGGKRDRREIDTNIMIDYVLPDYQNTHHGIVRPHDPEAARNARKPSAQSPKSYA